MCILHLSSELEDLITASRENQPEEGGGRLSTLCFLFGKLSGIYYRKVKELLWELFGQEGRRRPRPNLGS